MAWYAKKDQQVGNVLFLAALNPVWSAERTNCEVKYCDVDNIRKAVSENTDIAVVFMTEGMFQTKGVFKFDFQFSNRIPLHITSEAAFVINVFISQWPKAEQEQLNDMLKGENGRQIFNNLVQMIFKEKNDQEGGLKVESDKPPPFDGPGDHIVPLKELEQQEA